MPTQRLTGALYEASDGRLLQLTMIRTDEAFDKLLVAMEAYELLADERFATLESRMANAEDLTKIMRELFLLKSSDEWMQLLHGEHGLPVERVAEFSDLPADPHLQLNGMVSPPVDDVGIDYIINDPVNVDGVARVGAKKAPGIGEHTDEVLTELGFDEDQISRFHEQGVVGK